MNTIKKFTITNMKTFTCIKFLATDLKSAALLLLTMILSFASNAQTLDVRLGLKTGMNYSNTFGTSGESFSTEPKFGFAIGTSLSFPINKTIGIQPEVLYSQKGFHGTGIIFGEPYSVTRTTGHFDFPLQIIIKPFKFLSLLAGPQYSFLSSTKDDFHGSQLTTEQKQQITINNHRKNMVSLVLGTDIKVNHFLLSGRLGWDMGENSTTSSATSFRYKNKWTQITIGYMFYEGGVKN